MPRSPRIYLQRALYYVTSKGDHNQPIFKDQEDYKGFMDLLKKYKAQYRFKLFAYCLASQHFHLLLELPMQKEEKYQTGDLSNIMHDLNSSYTKYFNGKYGRKGHLFRDRYKATLIEKKPYLLKLSAYIHLNPQRLNLSLRPQEFPYSSYAFYIDKELSSVDWLKEEKEEVSGLLGGRSYEEFMQKVAQEKDFSFLHNYLQRGVLGSEGFEKEANRAFLACKKEKGAQSGVGLGRKLGIISFALIFAGLGITYILKSTLEKKGKTSTHFPLSYKLPSQIKELLRDLENIEWQIKVVSLSGGQVQNDIVYFEEGKFVSRNYSLQSYPPSDYSLLIEDEDKITWEATQTGEGGVISWRGEIKKADMEGNFRLRSSDGRVQDFSFVSTNSRRRRSVRLR